MLYCINNRKLDNGTASAKAPDDISVIAKGIGLGEIVFFQPRKYQNLNLTRFFAMFTGVKNWKRLYSSVDKQDWVILQHPNENIVVGNRAIDKCKKKKNIHFIAMIHDLDSLRRSVSLQNPETLDNRNNMADEVLLKKCDYIICHNDSMKRYLISRGFDVDKIISLEIFDYLHDCTLPMKRRKDKSIVVAGNLLENKCRYLYKLLQIERDYEVHLFGPNYTGNSGMEKVEYHGVLPADELPGKLQGSFGLVWDGTEIDTCSGDTGAYLRYNNPHKVSLFLSSNMPVIIWKEAALASFVEENHLGITVDSLTEIGSRIDSMTEQEYDFIVNNVIAMGEKLRSGYFIKRAISEVMEKAGI